MAAHNTQNRRAQHNARAAALARGLGWLSIGVGLAQIFAPRVVCRLAGLPPAPMFTRLCGMRELACGIGILTQAEPAPWLKARVAGDVMDLACLAAAAPLERADGARIGVALAVVAGVTSLDVYCGRELASRRKPSPLYVRSSIAVDRPPEELYRFWRDLQNLPRVMPHLKSVQALEGNRTHWVAAGPRGVSVEWDSELIDDKPNVLLAWRSVEESAVFNAGSAYFEPAPAGRGTLVTVELLYDPPAGSFVASVANLLSREAGQDIRADLRAFKQLMETGGIATTERLPSGR